MDEKENALAAVRHGPPPIILVGTRWITAVESDPSTVIPNAVHELHGHPEYDAGGDGVGALVFDAAKEKLGTRLGSPDPDAVFNTFDYPETEIYAVLRAMPYFDHAARSLGGGGFAPEVKIPFLLSFIRAQFDPRVATAMLYGLRVRDERTID